MEPSDSINSDGAMHTVDKKVAERRSPTLQQLFTAWTFARRKRLVEERAARLGQGVENRKETRLRTREMDRKKTKDQDKKRQEVAVENNKDLWRRQEDKRLLKVIDLTGHTEAALSVSPGAGALSNLTQRRKAKARAEARLILHHPP